MNIEFEPADGGNGVDLVDPIERHRYALYAPAPVSPTSADPDHFLFPVDSAVAITAESITLPTVVPLYVRDEEGAMLAEAEHFADETFGPGTYSVEICGPIKVYLRVDGPMTVASNIAEMYLEFDEETDVLIGARSHHKNPAETVTTTDDPVDMMAAVSTFGSALKTTSPERSYPSLRGHPPAVELGEELSMPGGLSPSDTGIRIELPPDYRSVYVSSPLAYYLGAELVPGSTPRIVTDRGFEHPLDTRRGFEAEVERVLKQTFFLDCVTRTEGYYAIDLHERNAVESLVDLDFPALYDRPIAEQLATYLEVPFPVIEDHLPDWKLTTHVELDPGSVETLPFVVNDLAVIRSPERAQVVSGSEIQRQAIATFTRNETLTRSAADTPSEGEEVSYVQPETTNALEHAWIGDSTPVGASKATPEAFRNRIARRTADGDISITVVCNDPRMDEERDIVDEVYGSRERLPFDVTLHHDLGADAFRDVLTSEIDFLHYIGHIDHEGIRCADGQLDAATLDSVGVDAFVLNACESYNQGMHLIEAGAIGGVVTISEVINSGAVRVGETMARLLNRGFPLRAALTIAREESIMGGRYIVVGDGGLAIAQSESGIPYFCTVEREDDGFVVDVKAYPTSQKGMGAMFIPFIEDNSTYFLGSGTRRYRLSRDELARFLQLDDVPVRVDGEVRWSRRFDVSEL